jgi:hypothetical protein
MSSHITCALGEKGHVKLVFGSSRGGKDLIQLSILNDHRPGGRATPRRERGSTLSVQ